MIFIGCKVIHALLRYNNILHNTLLLKELIIHFSLFFPLSYLTYFAIRDKPQIYSLNGLKRRRDRNLKGRPRLKINKNRRARFLWLHDRIRCRHPGWGSVGSRSIDHQWHFQQDGWAGGREKGWRGEGGGRVRELPVEGTRKERPADVWDSRENIYIPGHPITRKASFRASASRSFTLTSYCPRRNARARR